jgi:proteasome accessory factor A
VIVGDANLSEVATFLKVGTTAWVLTLIEDDALPRQFRFASPVGALRQVSQDLTVGAPLLLDDGSTVTALDVQWELLGAARAHAQRHGTASVGASGTEVLDRWERVLTTLEREPLALGDQLDWVAKYRLVEAYRERHGLDWNHPRLAALDLQYHDLRPASSLFDRLGVERLVDDEAAAAAMHHPPTDTRAYFRGEVLRRWGPDVVAANWDSVVFDVGEEPLRRVPMMDPTRGTADLVGTLLDECSTPAELLGRLEA